MRQFNEEDQKNICKLYVEQGWTIEELRKHYHCKKEAIRNVLLLNNIKIKKRLSKNRLLKEDYFDVIDCEEKAYFLGLLFTDGSVVLDSNSSTNRSPQISLQLKVEDIDLVKAFKDAVQSGGTLTFDKRKNKECVSIKFRSQYMADSLSKYGIVPNKTYITKHFPQVPREFLRDFLRGCLDGDGSIYQETKSQKYRIDFCSFHKSICEDFKNMCQELGIPNNNTIANYGTAYHIRYNTQQVVKELATLLYKDSKISLVRKYRLAERLFLEDNSEEDIVYSDH